MATWYRTDKKGIEIDAVEAEEETPKFIRLTQQNVRVPKRSSVHNYFPTRGEAVTFLKARCERRIAGAKLELIRAEKELEELMKAEAK